MFFQESFSEIEKNENLKSKYKKITNKYEFINTNIQLEKIKNNYCVCSYKSISRSYFKLIEILYNFNFNFVNNFYFPSLLKPFPRPFLQKLFLLIIACNPEFVYVSFKLISEKISMILL